MHPLSKILCVNHYVKIWTLLLDDEPFRDIVLKITCERYLTNIIKLLIKVIPHVRYIVVQIIFESLSFFRRSNSTSILIILIKHPSQESKLCK